jgi:molybdenum cofactor guanylyltransferase
MILVISFPKVGAPAPTLGIDPRPSGRNLMKRGAVVLCGGKSTRMGRDKATLPFGPETMLQRVVRLLGEVVPTSQIVVVGAAGQVLPPLPDEVVMAWDEHTARGPLEGMAAGLHRMPPQVEAVYVTSCDVPLLVPAFVDRMFTELGDAVIAVPFDGEHHHPLAAVYRTSVLSTIERLLAADQLRPRALFDQVATRTVDVATLRDVDPELLTLENLNHAGDYESARQRAGFT